MSCINNDNCLKIIEYGLKGIKNCNNFEFIKNKTTNIINNLMSSLIIKTESNKDINIIIAEDIFKDDFIKEIFFKVLSSKFRKTKNKVNIIINNYITNSCDICEQDLIYDGGHYNPGIDEGDHQIYDLQNLLSSIDTNLKSCSIINHFYKFENLDTDFSKIFYNNKCIAYLDITNCEIPIIYLINLLKNLEKNLIYLNVSTDNNLHSEVSDSNINTKYKTCSMFFYLNIKEIINYFKMPKHNNVSDYINELILLSKNKSCESSGSSESSENMAFVVEVSKHEKLQTLNIKNRKDFSTIIQQLMIGFYYNKNFSNLVINLNDILKEDCYLLKRNVKFITDIDNYNNYFDKNNYFEVSTDILDKNNLTNLLYDNIVANNNLVISNKFFNSYYFGILSKLLLNNNYDLNNLKLDYLAISYNFKWILCSQEIDSYYYAVMNYLNTIDYDLITLYEQILSKKMLLNNIKYIFVANKNVDLDSDSDSDTDSDLKFNSKNNQKTLFQYYCESNNIIKSSNLLISIIGELNNRITYIDISNNYIYKKCQWIKLCRYLKDKTNLQYLDLSNNFMDCNYKYLIEALITTNSNSQKINNLKRKSLKTLKLPKYYGYTKNIKYKYDFYKIQEEIKYRKILLRNLKNIENKLEFIKAELKSRNLYYSLNYLHSKIFFKYFKN